MRLVLVSLAVSLMAATAQAQRHSLNGDFECQTMAPYFEFRIKGKQVLYRPMGRPTAPMVSARIIKQLDDINHHGFITAYRLWSKGGGIGNLILQRAKHCSEAGPEDGLIQFFYTDKRSIFEGCCERAR